MLEQELVWVVPKQELDEALENRKGLIMLPLEDALSLLKNTSFLPKNKAETNTDFLQIVPYFATTHGSNFVMQRRTKVAGEQRLYNKLAFFGGHINSNDNVTNNPIDTFWRGAMREFHEELDAKPFVFNFLGLIRLDANPVDSVHLGFAFHIRLGDFVGVKEKEKYIPEIFPISEAPGKLNEMETWARLCVEAILANEKKG